VHTLAASIERDAQADPPTAAGAVILDRLIPLAGTPPGPSEVTVLDASAALVAALDRAQRTNDLTLREFRAAVAAAEITSRSAATVTAAARTLTGALHTDIGRLSDLAAARSDRDALHLAGTVQQITGQLPVLADQLIAAVDRWSRTGRLYASARDQPQMANMPEDRIKAVIAGRHVRASGADLDRLRQAVDRAADLSTGLADALHRTAGTRPPAQGHQADRHAREAQLPVVAERLLSHAQAVERDVTTIRSSHRRAREAPPFR
jgi:hypothetical protein